VRDVPPLPTFGLKRDLTVVYRVLPSRFHQAECRVSLLSQRQGCILLHRILPVFLTFRPPFLSLRPEIPRTFRTPFFAVARPLFTGLAALCLFAPGLSRCPRLLIPLGPPLLFFFLPVAAARPLVLCVPSAETGLSPPQPFPIAAMPSLSPPSPTIRAAASPCLPPLCPLVALCTCCDCKPRLGP